MVTKPEYRRGQHVKGKRRAKDALRLHSDSDEKAHSSNRHSLMQGFL
jgi:hypothetical protein